MSIGSFYDKLQATYLKKPCDIETVEGPGNLQAGECIHRESCFFIRNFFLTKGGQYLLIGLKLNGLLLFL